MKNQIDAVRAAFSMYGQVTASQVRNGWLSKSGAALLEADHKAVIKRLEEYESLLRDVVRLCDPVCSESTAVINRIEEMLND